MAYDDILVCTKEYNHHFTKGKHYNAYVYLNKVSLTNNFGVIIEHNNDNWFKEHFTNVRKHREEQINKLIPITHEHHINLYKELYRLYKRQTI